MKQVKPMALTISLVISTGFSLYLSFSSTAKAISDKLFSMVIFIINNIVFLISKEYIFYFLKNHPL